VSELNVVVCVGRMRLLVELVPGKVRKGCVKLSCLVDDLVTQEEKLETVICILRILNVIDKTAQGSRAGGKLEHRLCLWRIVIV
jgi:hypothetical protein